MNAANKEELAKKVRSTKWQNYVAASAVVLAAASFWVRSCTYKPEPERIVEQAPCTDAGECQQGPQRGGTCEWQRGESDPRATTVYDPMCGTCGNDVRDPGETEENCPADFHCGNGRVDRNEKYSAFTQTQDGVWSLGRVVERTESCNARDPNYCQADCDPRSGAAQQERDRRASTRTPRGSGSAGPSDSPPVRSGGPCPDTGGASEIRSDVTTALNSALEPLARAHEGSGIVTATISVSPDGRVTGARVASSCIGSCTNPSVNASSIVGNLGVVGSSVGSQPGVNCTISVQRRFSQ